MGENGQHLPNNHGFDFYMVYIMTVFVQNIIYWYKLILNNMFTYTCRVYLILIVTARATPASFLASDVIGTVTQVKSVAAASF